MKKINYAIIAIFITGIVLSSCVNIPETALPSNTPSPSSNVSSISPFLSLSLNGTGWTSSPTGVYNLADSTVTVTGTNGGNTVTFVFNFNQSNKSIQGATVNFNNASYSYNGLGTISINSPISQIPGAVSGTFAFDIYNVASTSSATSISFITNGSFLVKNLSPQ